MLFSPKIPVFKRTFCVCSLRCFFACAFLNGKKKCFIYKPRKSGKKVFEFSVFFLRPRKRKIKALNARRSSGIFEEFLFKAFEDSLIGKRRRIFLKRYSISLIESSYRLAAFFAARILRCWLLAASWIYGEKDMIG